MRYPFASLVFAFCCLCSTLHMRAAGATALELTDQTAAFEVSTPVLAWIEPGRTASVEQAAAQGTFSPTAPGTLYELNSQNTLWIKLPVRSYPEGHTAWSLNIPLTSVDVVVLHQQTRNGQWVSQSGGTEAAGQAPSKHGLYPEFDLLEPADSKTSIYLQIRNISAVNVPLRLAPTHLRDGQRIAESSALGLVLGCVLSLTLLSFFRYAEHRNRIDFLGGAYSMGVILTIASLNGVTLGMLWLSPITWPPFSSHACMAITMGVALFLLRDAYAMSTRHRRYDPVLVSVALLALASPLSLLLLERASANLILSSLTLLAALVGFVGAALTLRFRSRIGWLLFAAYALQFLGVLRLIVEAWAWVPVWWEFRYLISLTYALSVPLLVYALSRATHDRKELVVRANHLPNQDALTGLLTREAFLSQYKDAYRRVADDGAPVALVLVSLINHQHIRQAFNDTTAEQCLLRAVIKLHRLLRDVDPAGRVDTARFALLLEGVADKDALNNRMVKLIASGHIPIPGLVPQVTLQFHAACVLLHHHLLPTDQVLPALEALLQEMTPRTRRPIRFLEAPQTRPVE